MSITNKKTGKMFALKIFSNPFYAINIDPELTGEHEPMVTKKGWVKVAMKVMKEEGEEKFLKSLLDVLEGKWV